MIAGVNVENICKNSRMNRFEKLCGNFLFYCKTKDDLIKNHCDK